MVRIKDGENFRTDFILSVTSIVVAGETEGGYEAKRWSWADTEQNSNDGGFW